MSLSASRNTHMKWHYFIVKGKEILDSEGCRGIILRTAKKIRRMLFVTNDAHWFVRDLTERIERPSPKISISVELSDNEETIRWLRENHSRFGWMYIPDELSLARACGHYLPRVRLDGKVIGYIKIARERAYVLDYERELRLPLSVAFVYDTFVLPEYRGQRIASFLIAEAMAFLREKGYRRSWCHIPAWNTASIGAFRRSGFKRVAHVRFFKVFGHRFFSINPEKLIRRLASRSREAGASDELNETLKSYC